MNHEVSRVVLIRDVNLGLIRVWVVFIVLDWRNAPRT